ncbi:extracellular matrix protein-binding adhesin Emp [Staphylococcus argenteus]|uniref:extracellular matrix protein-binding adhesin Emp n=1 Tax=Staphylococcus argenteus TaxID=985002 RepID=UPI0009179BBE|nr:extracellular matrix protein-binding adhesin Emp [Staphylococcus argenteus]MCG9855841.1 extracellular matrix protein-binding adhesin Emp [Staphylococcus argenteus]MDR7649208.1 extracellular matrix protein-binding adhesin Emp [Staphylococcus argenteus]MDR7681909.1 extracellular matrix protein-binding adhesin Emp [Staphylococcus argenteus]SGW58345.1 Extracellular ECM and plasma binding protein Emp [Staphylococcus argenteus]SGX31603.1 Extracellular ECM and plasma binding protein Emp [Staphyloc
MKKKLLVLTMGTLFATQIINSNHAKASTESVDKNFVVPESGINKILPGYSERNKHVNVPELKAKSLAENKNFVASEDQFKKFTTPSNASRLVDKNFVVPESKIDKIVPSYKDKDKRVNVPATITAPQKVDSNFVVKGPELNRFITQNIVNQRFITTQTHFKKVTTSYKTTRVYTPITHHITTVNRHFVVKPSEAPKYTHPSTSITSTVNQHFVVPGANAHKFVTPGHASIKVNHFCVVPPSNSIKVIPSLSQSSQRVHVPNFHTSTSSINNHHSVNKTYSYKYFYTYKFVKNLNSYFSFSKSNEHKNIKPALNIKNVNYQYAVPSTSPTHSVPEFNGILPAPRV